jgi:hypothetical protein
VDQKRGVALPATTHKHCPHCAGYLLLEDFRPDPKLKSGLSSWCAKCSNEYNQKWRSEHRDQIDAYDLARRVEPTKLKCSECDAEFYGRPNRKSCSPECRKLHKARLDTRWQKRAA